MMEPFSIEDPAKKKEKLATRRLLILAISCLVCAVVFAAVVAILIVTADKKIIINPDQQRVTIEIETQQPSSTAGKSDRDQTWLSSPTIPMLESSFIQTDVSFISHNTRNPVTVSSDSNTYSSLVPTTVDLASSYPVFSTGLSPFASSDIFSIPAIPLESHSPTFTAEYTTGATDSLPNSDISPTSPLEDSNILLSTAVSLDSSSHVIKVPSYHSDLMSFESHDLTSLRSSDISSIKTELVEMTDVLSSVYVISSENVTTETDQTMSLVHLTVMSSFNPSQTDQTTLFGHSTFTRDLNPFESGQTTPFGLSTIVSNLNSSDFILSSQQIISQTSSYGSTEITNSWSTSSDMVTMVTTAVPHDPKVTLPPCSDQEFRCQSGQCVQQSFRCDRFYHCEDQSDEMNCSGCFGFECASGLCLWRWTAQCNGIVECMDLSDEIGCPSRSGHRQCQNGIWIPDFKWCDGVDSCYDNSDEINCTCDSRTEVQCGNSQCVRHEWVCDGYLDCDTDEMACSNCTSDQYVCDDYTCVNQTDVCDGRFHCTQGEDEFDCFSLQGNTNSSDYGTLVGMLRGDNYSICSTHWSSILSDGACHMIGVGDHNETDYIPILKSSGVYLELIEPAASGASLEISMFNATSTCATNTTVSISCLDKACGRVAEDVMVAYVAGGNLATAGKWPWVASISYLGKSICSGALINNRWIVTAGHCIARSGVYNYSSTPQFIEALLGSTEIARIPPTGAVKFRAEKISHHPNLTWTGFGPIYWDIALIKLERAVIYSSLIQPICLPSVQQQFSPSDSCYLAGWGHIGANQEVPVEDLREAKLRLLSDKECQENTVTLETEVNTNITICTSYNSGVMSGCQGDSGGPLMCLDNGDSWTLAGVLSSGSVACGTSTQVADRFTKVSAFTDWIHSIIQNN